MTPETVYLIGILPVTAAVFAFGLRRARTLWHNIEHQRGDLRGWIIWAAVVGALWPFAIIYACALAAVVSVVWVLAKGVNAIVRVIIPDPDTTGPQRQ